MHSLRLTAGDTAARCSAILAIAGAAWLAHPLPAAAEITSVRIASGLDSPLYVTAAPGDDTRLFIVEQGTGGDTGRIRVLDRTSGTVHATPFLEISGLATAGEQGLLGLAFHPAYQSNGRFYVNYTEATAGGRTTHVREYQVSADPDAADPGSARDLLLYDQPQANHNGGWIGFGPDNLLYIASGDGGGDNDDDAGHTNGTGNGQDTNTLLGKILRIDVNGDDFPGDPNRNYAIPLDNPFTAGGGAAEVWAYGLRNPWRASFDRATGDFYVADVGQDTREEVNVQPAGSGGGENYGWRLREGTVATPTPEEDPVGGERPPDAIDPIYGYPHGGADDEGGSVTGGYVYRGPIAEIQGHYFFGDFLNSRIWSLVWDESDPTTFDGTNYTDFTDRTDDLAPDAGSIDQVASFGQDNAGNLFLVDRDGEVFQLVPEPGTFALSVAGLGAAAAWFAARRPSRRKEARRPRLGS